MQKRILLRLAAALMAVMLLAQPVLAETVSDEFIEAQAAPVEDAVEESVDLMLPGEDEGDIDLGEAAESFVLPVAEANFEGETTPAAETETALEAADPGTRSFSATENVNGGTWKDVNLTRAAGFTGKLATVTGTLALANVTIEGQSAREVNLLDYFDLSMGASIVVTDDAALSLSLAALSINKGSARTLKVTYNGASVKGNRVKWKTSAKKLATVNENGRVTAKGKGAATITASYKGKKAVCYLDVTGVVYPKSVKLNKKTYTLALNNMVALKAKIKPANPDDKTLTWTSSNPEVVSVDAQGNIAGLAKGKATVTVRTSNGKTASCKVTVKAVKAKSLDFNRLYVTMHPGETFQTAITVKPANTSYPGATYSSSDTSVATVDAAGAITAVGTGTATITAVSAYSAKIKNTCKVCVIEQGAAQLEGLVIGINPGHQKTTIKKRYPLAPGRHSYAYGVKVGATGCSTRQCEYEVVLQVGLKLKRILEEHGAKVVITRTSNDVMLTNIDRAKMLNAANVDVALQLHNNSCSNAGKTGQSGYIRTTGDWVAESKALAKQLTKHISKTTGFKNRGINYYNDYMSLNWTTTPSVLLEMGYLSNSSDDHKLAKDSFREKLAQGIYEGLCAYFGR